MSATRSLEISAEIAAQEREQKKREIAEARDAGGLAYHDAIRYIDGEPAKEAAAHSAFMSGNPYPDDRLWRRRPSTPGVVRGL